MKRLILLFFLASGAFITPAVAQDCEGLVSVCEGYLNGTSAPGNFVSDGQVYTAFLDREKSEFKTTFYGGSTYRIVATAGKEDDFVIFTVRDMQGNIIFTNRDHKNSTYWDFKVNKTIPVTIETELDMDKKVTGCTVMLIGFKKF